MDIDVFSTGRFRPNNGKRSFKNIVLLKIVLADDGELLLHTDMALKDQISRKVCQQLVATIFRIIREANPFVPIVFDALLNVG